MHAHTHNTLQTHTHTLTHINHVKFTQYIIHCTPMHTAHPHPHAHTLVKPARAPAVEGRAVGAPAPRPGPPAGAGGSPCLQHGHCHQRRHHHQCQLQRQQLRNAWRGACMGAQPDVCRCAWSPCTRAAGTCPQWPEWGWGHRPLCCVTAPRAGRARRWGPCGGRRRRAAGVKGHEDGSPVLYHAVQGLCRKSGGDGGG